MAKIYWKSNITDASWHGTIDFEKEHADKICAELNEEYSNITHWSE